MRISLLAAAAAALPAVLMTADLHHDVLKAVSTFKTADPSMQKFFDSSAGYAVFPGITKGAMGVGAAHGDGEVLVHGAVIGTTSMTQVTIGAQLGGQQYSEVIFFQDKDALDGFKGGHFTMAAQVSAVAAAEGASANAKYSSGVAVFTVAKGGLMYEASIGGQKFSYHPKETT
jgi:lipid-binding SYLF domain-containing protein